MMAKSRCGLQKFQSTLPRRERPGVAPIVFLISRFQSTLPRRERRWKQSLPVPAMRFQSTLPRRERRHIRRGLKRWTGFQSTLPRRERHRHVIGFYPIFIYFNPRSRVGSDTGLPQSLLSEHPISIHAPA